MNCSMAAGPVVSTTPPRPADPGTPPQAIVPITGPLCASIQNVRVNIHYMLTTNGGGNFSETSDNYPASISTTLNGYTYAAALMSGCNDHWDLNPPLLLPPGSSLTPVPKRIHLTLNGVYFHRNDAARTYGSSTIWSLRRYLVDSANTINIFMQESALLGTGPAPTFNGGEATQISYSTINDRSLWTRVWGGWSNRMQPWQMAATVNHEVGHLLGLNHPHMPVPGWTTGICADAPANPNCWGLNSPAANPLCANPANLSNNMMDYNAVNYGVSPCQVGIMQTNLNTGLRRFVASCDPCVPVSFSLRMPASTCTTNIWLDGSGAIAAHWFDLTIERLGSKGVALSTFTTRVWRGLGREQLDTYVVFQPNARYRATVTGLSACSTALPATRSVTFMTDQNNPPCPPISSTGGRTALSDGTATSPTPTR